MTNIKNWKGENRQCKLCHIFIPHLGFLNQLFQIFVFTLYIIKNCNYFIHLSIVNVVILSSLYFNSWVQLANLFTYHCNSNIKDIDNNDRKEILSRKDSTLSVALKIAKTSTK